MGAADPTGGLLLAGEFDLTSPGFSPPDGKFIHAALMYSGGGAPPSVRWGPQPLAASGTVFGAGLDALGRSLVITGGRLAGSVTAQWFDRDGTAPTGEFELLIDSCRDRPPGSRPRRDRLSHRRRNLRHARPHAGRGRHGDPGTADLDGSWKPARQPAQLQLALLAGSGEVGGALRLPHRFRLPGRGWGVAFGLLLMFMPETRPIARLRKLIHR